MMLENVSSATTKTLAEEVLLRVFDLQKKDMKGTDKKQEMEIPGSETNKCQQYFTMFMAEVIGTGVLMFLGCMGCVTQVDDPPAVHHMSSLAFGLIILLIIQAFGHISGAHLNPAVTIAALLNNVMSLPMGVVYFIAQFIGAISGFALLKGPFTGASMNTVRTFCPALLEGNFEANGYIG
ncbi:hypothetical protein NQ317_004689 [Molorchus minor]|uniref:Uncharacterized protein n=1 Tax=Molorchus minor TaxID=1323400 RepID=A0ABQ9JEF0_9CUCU|nr:hypothetical protein NQ317_004689 [Molorchus minor]